MSHAQVSRPPARPTPDREALTDLVLAAVALVCEVEASSLSTAISLEADLAADSLARVEIVEVTEASLRAMGSSLTFADEDLDGFETVGDVVAYLQDRAVA